MRKKISDHFYLGNKYQEEFRKQMRLIVVFTLGFTIALPGAKQFLMLLNPLYNGSRDQMEQELVLGLFIHNIDLHIIGGLGKPLVKG